MSLDAYLNSSAEESMDSDFPEFNKVRGEVILALGGFDPYLANHLPKVGTTRRSYSTGYGDDLDSDELGYETYEYCFADARVDAEKDFWEAHRDQFEKKICNLIPENRYAIEIAAKITEKITEEQSRAADELSWTEGRKWLKSYAHLLEVPNSGNAIGVNLQGLLTVNGVAVNGTQIVSDLDKNLELVEAFVQAKAERKAAKALDTATSAAKNLEQIKSKWELRKNNLSKLKEKVVGLGFTVLEKDFDYVVQGSHEYRRQNKGTKFRWVSDPSLTFFAEIKGIKCPPMRRDHA